MADMEVQKGGAEKTTTETKAIVLNAVTVLEVAAPKADEAVQFYKKVFGAVEMKRGMNSKRKADLESPLIDVLLKFGSSQVVVVDRLEDELKAHQNSTVILSFEGDVEAVIKKVVAAGGVTEGDLELKIGEAVTEGPIFSGSLFGKVKDPFGIVWKFSGNKTATGAVSGIEPNNTTAAEAVSNTQPNNTAA